MNEQVNEAPTEMPGEWTKEAKIVRVKEHRLSLDAQLQSLKYLQSVIGPGPAGRQLALAVTHCEDVILRLGLTLKELGTENPYPNSYKPENAIVDPTAQGLKM